MTFRNAVKALSPGPLQEGVGERFMYVFGFCADGLMQKMTEAGLARMPTRCDPSCLPVIGSDRLIGQGLTETTDSYRVRLQKAFESWQLAGSARAVLVQALAYVLSATPRARAVSTRYSGNVADLLVVRDATNASPIEITVNRPSSLKPGDTVTVTAVEGNTAANVTTTISPVYTSGLGGAVPSPTRFTLDGTTGNAAYTGGGLVSSPVFPTVYPPDPMSSQWDTYEAGQDPQTAPIHVYNDATSSVGANMDWDSLTLVAGSWIFTGAYLIIESIAGSTGEWVGPATWTIGGTSQPIGELPGSIGLSCSWKVVQSLRTIVGQWKAGGAALRWIIISFNSSLFDPTQPAGGGINPDGRFGRWSKLVAGAWVPARFTDARYCHGVT